MTVKIHILAYKGTDTEHFTIHHLYSDIQDYPVRSNFRIQNIYTLEIDSFQPTTLKIIQTQVSLFSFMIS